MNILVLKLLLAPIIIGSASLAGRKWGSAVSGWIVGLPLTSGPVAFIIALSHDRAFAFDTVRGTLSGAFSLVAYALAYVLASKRFNWAVSIATSALVFASMTTILQGVTLPLVPLFCSVLAVLAFGLLVVPHYDDAPADVHPGKWDVPARILIGVGFILLVTEIAPYVGSRLTGLLTTIPLYVSIMAVFAHRRQGRAGAVNLLRGLLLGMFSFAGFYLVLGLLLKDFSLAVSFGAATATTLLVQGASGFLLRRG